MLASNRDGRHALAGALLSRRTRPGVGPHS